MTEEEAKKLLLQADDLYEQEKLNETIKILRKIQYEDSPKQYAKAQLNLGVILAEQGEMEAATTAWRNISREDNPKSYAKAQFNLGVALEEQGDIKGAISAWHNITRKDSTETYAQAQFNLGVILGKQGEMKKAIVAWRNIIRKDATEQYMQAQFNIGVALEEQGDIKGAISVWRNITRKDSTEVYAQAQLNLGVFLEKRGDRKGAISAWRNIIREDSPEEYAKAQFNLGIILGKLGDTKRAIVSYRNITREDSPELYMYAQFNLGVFLEKRGDRKGAISAWSNITREDYPEEYAKAQFNLGVALLTKPKDIENARNAFLNSRHGLYYQPECILKILGAPTSIQPKLHEIHNTATRIINSLFISEDMANNRILKVAHYTRPYTALEIIAGKPIEGNELNSKPSSFRLSTIKGVNDPKEGKVLYEYMQEKCNFPLKPITEALNQTTAVFIGCFTFNHDSLNQFRLYGKEDGREASGVSLIFNQRFFGYDDPFGSMAAVTNEAIEEIKMSNHDKKSTPEQKKMTDSKKLLKPLPLYHCIYLDPHSGYLSIAQRDKSTFYAEEWYGNKKSNHDSICQKAEKKWKDYQKGIIKITKTVEQNLSKITQIIEGVIKKTHDNRVLEVITFILQPLRYLIKHIAFQEEQECRMLYISDIATDSMIKSRWDIKQMYVEYSIPVKDSLDKIYLSPGAQPYEDFFKKELPDLAKTGKIRHSRNPFRNK